MALKASLSDLPGRRRRFRSCQSGATAVEFGFVVVPVLTLLLGIVDFSLIAWRSSTLHSGVIVLQSAIQQNVADRSNYQTLFCDAAGALVACDQDLRIVVRPLDPYVNPRPRAASTGGQAPRNGGATAPTSGGSSGSGSGSDSGAFAASTSGSGGSTGAAPAPTTAATPTPSTVVPTGPRGMFNVRAGEPFVIETTYRHQLLTPFIDKIVPGRVIRSKIVIYSQRPGS